MERKSSLETEPRTLNFDEIQYARQAAMYVMNTRSAEEAMNIFTEGLKPIATVTMQNEKTMNMDSVKEDCPEDNQLITPVQFRDVASAPF